MSRRSRTLWIDSTQLYPIDSRTWIPTALHYNVNSLPELATSAEQKSDSSTGVVNRKFKIDLGYIRPGRSPESRVRRLSSDGRERSAFDLSNDFFRTVLGHIQELQYQSKEYVKLLVAEPLSLHETDQSKTWTTNYRENIRRILNGYKVDFLPEPFAVYQYYRHGLRVPTLSSASKQIAFIVDFGGGTFDASIIETTKDGEISAGGKMARPLAASSCAVGGEYLNIALAEHLLTRDLERKADKNKVRTALETFRRVQSGELALTQLNKEKRAVIQHFEDLVSRVENTKLELCDKIQVWKLDRTEYNKAPIELPIDPFSIDCGMRPSALQEHELRDVFVNKLWNQGIRRTVKQVLDRADGALDGRSITVTLLSGGSSNVRYLQRLLEHHFEDWLGTARPIPISASFHEVVAKGLAIESARRNYSPESEFSGVTYNPIKLYLAADNEPASAYRFEPVENRIDMTGGAPGDLLPSAQDLSHFIEEPLQWKCRLTRAPKRTLHYYFVRPTTETPSEAANDNANTYNVESAVHTPPNASFDSQIRVELTVREDGTATPRFIYKVGNEEKGIPATEVTGAPFVLDVTAEETLGAAEMYIGFDFGTSTTSVCKLSANDIRFIDTRKNSTEWREVQDVVNELPYPVAYPVRKYLAAGHPDKQVGRAREAFEAGLAFAAYTALSELVAKRKSVGSFLKTFAHRSVGPLADVLRKILSELGNDAEFSAAYKTLFDDDGKRLKSASQQFNAHKHEGLDASAVEAHQHVRLIANLNAQALSNRMFGYFEYLSKASIMGTKHEGVFKCAHGVQPFTRALEYEGDLELHRNVPVIVNEARTGAILCFPFYCFDDDSSGGLERVCYVLDKIYCENVSYKRVDRESTVDAREIGEEVVDVVKALREGNVPYSGSEHGYDLSFWDRGDENE